MRKEKRKKKEKKADKKKDQEVLGGVLEAAELLVRAPTAVALIDLQFSNCSKRVFDLL